LDDNRNAIISVKVRP